MNRALIDLWLDEVPLRREVLAQVRARGVRAYLVGGTVRDRLLSRPSCDLDLAVEGGAMALARHVADRIKAAYVPLDAQHDVARVVAHTPQGWQHFDFAGLRAEGIQADLCARDFTVDAMAVALDDECAELIDPTGGQRDLAHRVLRVAYEGAFDDDPLRVLRAVRLRGALGFTVEPHTEALARARAAALRRVSPERVRDELALVLALRDAADTLTYAGSLGCLTVALPEFADHEEPLRQGIAVVAALEALCGACDERGGCGSQEYLRLCSQYGGRLAAHWSQELSFGRARWAVFKFAALLSALLQAEQVAPRAAQRLRLSAREVRFVEAVLRGSVASVPAPGAEDLPPLLIYRYYRAWGDAGVDAAVLSLARGGVSRDVSAGWGESRKQTTHVERLLRAWFDEHGRFIAPPALLTGHEIMEILGIQPGPALGRLVEALREAQAQGTVGTRAEAIAFLRARGSTEKL